MPTIARANRLALLLALALTFNLLPLAARADDASHRAKAEEMMALLHTEHNVRQISDSIMKQVTDAADKAAGDTPTPEQKAKIEAFKKQAAGLIDAQVGWATLKPGFIDLYVKSFTEEQLDAIIAFYKTPAGTALLEKMPEINSEFGRLGQSKVGELQDQLRTAYADFRKTVATPASSAAPAPAPRPAPTLAPAPAQ